MELARKIASPDMQTVAISYLNIDMETVRTIDDSRRGNKLMFNFDLLETWRNESPENTLDVRNLMTI